MRRFVLYLLSATCAIPVCCGQETAERRERGAWRISVGGSVIGGVKPNIGANAGNMVRLSGFGSSIGHLGRSGNAGRSKDEAWALGSGEKYGGKRVFDDGAWYDPKDSASANDGGWSWNWRLHNPSGRDPDGRKGYTEYTSYAAESETISTAIPGNGDGYSSDSSEWFPGLRVEAARELYRSEGPRPWGLDIAAAFAYYFDRGLWRMNGTAATATVNGSRETGKYEWWNDSEDTAQYILDYERGSQFHGGMWGAGTFDGPGAELETDCWRWRDVPGGAQTWSASHALRYDGNGDYREYSIELIARPWWEPWEWLRVFGSIGLEISRREFEWSMSAVGTDGSRFSESGDETDWRALGLFGGGFALQWHDFVLAGEALWRFGGEGLDVNGRTVHGEIEHGNWGFRLSLGYEF